jgi:hypothetical protein
MEHCVTKVIPGSHHIIAEIETNLKLFLPNKLLFLVTL